MIWLNIHLSTLRNPDYLGSGPVQRATWLQVLAYCVDQENSGRITGGSNWKDRQWQQTCGVTLREIRATGRLITRDGDDICVSFYPMESQEEVHRKREAGKKGGHASGASRAAAAEAEATAENEAKLQPQLEAQLEANAQALLERKEKERGMKREKEKESNETEKKGPPTPATAPHSAAPGARAGVEAHATGMAEDGEPATPASHPTPAEAITHGATLIPPCPENWSLKWWEDCERRGWVDREAIPIRKWRPALSSYWRGVQETTRRHAALQGTQHHDNPHHKKSEAHRDADRTGLEPGHLHLRRIDTRADRAEAGTARAATAGGE